MKGFFNICSPLDDVYFRPCVFQLDNAKPHTAAITTAWLRRRRVRLLNWPACSPDLSPIENIWHIVKQKNHNLILFPFPLGPYTSLPQYPSGIIQPQLRSYILMFGPCWSHIIQNCGANRMNYKAVHQGLPPINRKQNNG